MREDRIRALLKAPLDCRKPVALLRKALGAPPLYCVPLALDGALLLAALYVDFRFDGYQIVRLRDLSGIRDGRRTAFHARIMAGEQVLPEPVPFPLPLTGFAALLTALAAHGEPVAVEDRNGFYVLGRIEKVGKNRIQLRAIDAEGRLDGQSTRIAYEDIASVHFGGRYLRLVARYADVRGGSAARARNT